MWLRLSDVVNDLVEKVGKERDRAPLSEGWEADSERARSGASRQNNETAGREEIMARHRRAARAANRQA